MTKTILDASALLAWLNDEPGADKVNQALDEACIGAVNFAEAGAKLVDAGVPEDQLTDALDIGIDVIPFDRSLAIASSQLRPITKAYGLSLGDRSCLALGWVRGHTILTADLQWKKVKVPDNIKLRFIR